MISERTTGSNPLLTPKAIVSAVPHIWTANNILLQSLAIWPEPGAYDPIKALKLPNVIKAIGRGMAPKKAISLLDDGQYFELVDLRDYVGKRGKQLSRVRARIIGTKGKIREKIESLN